MSKLQNLQKALGLPITRKQEEKPAPAAKLPFAESATFELPIVRRVSDGRYDVILVPINIATLSGGRTIEHNQSLGVVKASMRLFLVKSTDKYLTELLK